MHIAMNAYKPVSLSWAVIPASSHIKTTWACMGLYGKLTIKRVSYMVQNVRSPPRLLKALTYIFAAQ